MTIGFRIVVPGLRVRVSNHGIRTTVGPRGARVSVGGGRRPTVSTGLGPFFASTALGRAPRSTPRRGTTPARLAAQQQALTRARADDEQRLAAAALAATLDGLVTLHRGSWPAATRPVVPAPVLPTVREVGRLADEATTAGISRLAVADRRAAARAAEGLVRQYLDAQAVQARRWQTRVQGEADAWWARLLANDERTVCEALTSAFSDDAAGGVAVGCETGTAVVVVTVPGTDELPPRRPDVTPAGRSTLKVLTARQLHRLFLDVAVSTVAATLREGFAVAPGLVGLTVLAVARSARTGQLGVVLAGTWSRTAVEATPWGTLDDDALRLVMDRADELHLDVAASGEARPLTAESVPAVGALLDLLDDAPDEEPGVAEGPKLFVPQPFGAWVAVRPAGAGSAEPLPTPPAPPSPPAPPHPPAGAPTGPRLTGPPPPRSTGPFATPRPVPWVPVLSVAPVRAGVARLVPGQEVVLPVAPAVGPVRLSLCAGAPPTWRWCCSGPATGSAPTRTWCSSAGGATPAARSS